MFPARTFVCPYCFDSANLKDVWFRCTSGPRWCAQEPDEIFQHFWNLPPTPLGRSFAPSPRERKRATRLFRALREAECDVCKRKSQTRLCPRCHGKLVDYIGECENLIVGVIGAKEAGKSHYIAVLIHELTRRIGPLINWDLSPANDETIKRYRRDFHEPIFKRSEKLPASRRAAVDGSMRMPLTYNLRLMGLPWWAKLPSFLDNLRTTGLLKWLGLNDKADSVLADVVLSFFDTAGEDLNSEDTMRVDNKYIYSSRGLILLLDPLQLEPVRTRLRGRVPLPEVNTETSEIIARTANLIRAGRGIRRGKIHVPIALAFSKCDALDSLFHPGHVLRRAAWYDSSFDARQYAEVQSKAEELLVEWGAGFLIQQLRASFETYGLFFVSALGCSPEGNGRIPLLNPRRVAEPLQWLLATNGIIRAAKN
jgi:hypothetical protein